MKRSEAIASSMQVGLASLSLVTVLLAAGLCLASLSVALAAPAGRLARPSPSNIVIFLVDDMGIMDTSLPFLTDTAGRPTRYPLNDFYRTPHLETYHGQDIFLTEALTFVANARVTDAVEAGQPFFLYFAHYAVHAPFHSDPRFAARYLSSSQPPEVQAFATLIEGMDKSLGDLLDYLDRLGVAESTLIFFLGRQTAPDHETPDRLARTASGRLSPGANRRNTVEAQTTVNPSGQFSVAVATRIRPHAEGKSGTLNQRKSV